MQILSNGMTAMFNGLFASAHSLGTPVSISIIISALCLGWLAVLECDELDRQGTKPIVGLH
jgi:hypothetical protein